MDKRIIDNVKNELEAVSFVRKVRIETEGDSCKMEVTTDYTNTKWNARKINEIIQAFHIATMGEKIKNYKTFYDGEIEFDNDRKRGGNCFIEFYPY